MRRNGNTAVNQIYNPKNKKPDIPLDADEVDSAMERFIRKKYQEKSLGSGRPEPPSRSSRSEISPTVPPKSPTYEPAAPLPTATPKKHRFFGFGLRASSSGHSSSKHDRKKLPPEPTVDNAWPISGDDVGTLSRSSAPVSDAEMQLKLTQLKDMGFPNREVNKKMLRRMNGDVARTIDALVQLGPQPAERTSSVSRVTPQPTGSSRSNVPTVAGSDSAQSGVRPSHTGASNNPFDQVSSGQTGFGLSMAPSQPALQQQPPQQQAVYGSNNPWDTPARSQTDGGLMQSFQNLHVTQPPAQPLFPNSTGGYAGQQYAAADPRTQTMTPPAMMSQYGYTSSPAPLPTNSNPFFQQPQQYQQQYMQSQQTGTNPFMMGQQPQQGVYQQQNVPSQSNGSMYGQQQGTRNAQAAQYGQMSPTTNPFMAQSPQPAQSPSAQASGYNPFGIPPAGQPQPTYGQQPQQVSADSGAQIGVPGLFAGNNANNPFQQQQPDQAQQQGQYANAQYGQQQTYLQQGQQQFGTNPYASLQQGQAQGQGQGQFAAQGQNMAMAPQQTGRYDKNSIMALYNYPSLTPGRQQQLSSIPEPGDEYNAGQSAGMPGQPMMAKRSATMPASMGNMHSAGGAGAYGSVNKNPFLQHSAQGGPSNNTGIMAHSSRDSMMINNLENGRHSPDAFANLSAKYA